MQARGTRARISGWRISVIGQLGVRCRSGAAQLEMAVVPQNITVSPRMGRAPRDFLMLRLVKSLGAGGAEVGPSGRAGVACPAVRLQRYVATEINAFRRMSAL
jgi:hypothetical protein